jgi:hypothetical protein
MAIRTNKNNLVKIAIEGKVAPAIVWPNEIGHDGRIHNVPGIGSITYNVFVGDPAFGWAADHVEPGVSTILNADKRRDKPNISYNFLACVGNEVRILSGEAKGKKGVVIGHHGGAEHVICDFSTAVLEKLSLDDKFQIRAFGQGLKLTDYPKVSVRNIDPQALGKIGLKEKGGKLEVPVSAIIPGALAGSGLGEANTSSGDFDIQAADEKTLAKHGIDKVKLGDIVAFSDCDASYGWCYRKGAVTVGVVVHGSSHVSGHGPGVTTIMSSSTGALGLKTDLKANVGRYLKLGRYRSQ